MNRQDGMRKSGSTLIGKCSLRSRVGRISLGVLILMISSFGNVSSASAYDSTCTQATFDYETQIASSDFKLNLFHCTDDTSNIGTITIQGTITRTPEIGATQTATSVAQCVVDASTTQCSSTISLIHSSIDFAHYDVHWKYTNHGSTRIFSGGDGISVLGHCESAIVIAECIV
jgi:hypothetical protein